MNSTHTNHNYGTALRRVIAFVLALSMVLIPVHFPGMVNAAEADAALPNYMTDKFGSVSYATDVTYQWEKSANVTLTDDGYLNFAGNKESAVITALKQDPTDSSKTTDIAQLWTDYTVEARINRTTAPGTNYMAGLVARVSQDANGLYSYYVLMVKGGNTTLYKVVGSANTQQYVPSDPVAVSLKTGVSGTAPTESNQWIDVKLVLKDATIQCYINGTLALEYTDDQGLGGDALLQGSAGIYKQASGWVADVDSFKVTHDDNSTAFYDDFSDSRYIDGVTYKWDQVSVVTPTYFKWEPSFANGSSWAVNDGKLTFSVADTDKAGKNYLYLFGADEGADAATEPYAWDNYSVQVDYTVNPKSDTDTDPVGGAHLFGRVQPVYEGTTLKGYVCYGLMMKNNNMYLSKYHYSSGSITKQALISTTAAVPKGTTATMKLSFDGNKVSAYILDAEGNQLNPADKTTYEDVGTYGDVITSGGIGMQAEHAYQWLTDAGGTRYAQYYAWSVSYDNLKVSTLDGTEVFADDFATSDYFVGKSSAAGTAVAEAWDVDYKWRGYSGRAEDNTQYVSIKEDHDGTLWIDGSTNRFDATLSGTAQNGTVDVTKYWTDYTLEARVDRSQAPATHYMAGVLGRISKDSDGKYSYYAIMLKGTSPNGVGRTNVAAEGDKLTAQVYRITGAANTYANVSGSLGQGTGGDATAQWTDLKVVFSGAEIKVYIDGDLAVSVTDTDPLPGGSVGAYKQANWQAASDDTDEAKVNRHYWVDSMKVTMADGQVVMEEDFTPTAEEVTTPSLFFTTPTTVEDAFVPTKWSVLNGAYTVSTVQPSLNLFSAVGGSNNYAQSWADYAVDANIMLSANDAWGSLVANAGDGKYYELRVEKTKASLYQVDGTTETLRASDEVELNTGSWYFTKLEVDGDGTSLKGYVDGALTVEYTFEDTTAAYAAGAPGLRANGSVKFDDLAVYPVELSDSREFAFYDFEVSDLDELSANWELEENGKWKLVGTTLVYEDTDPAAVGIFQLRKKATLDNYNAEVSVTTADAGEIGVIGRYDAAANSYYKLTLDLEKGLILSKTVNGDATVLASVSVEDLYLMGLQVKANTGYVLRLHMYQGTIQGYINGVRVLSVEDTAYLTEGVTALAATNGGAFVSLLTTEAPEPPALSILDENDKVVGTADAPMQIPLGKIPDIAYLFLQVGTGETAALIPVDTLEVSELDGTTLGDKTAEIKYDGRVVTLHYTIIDRTAEINALSDAIAALNVSALTLNDADAVEALVKQYDDLSYLEKENVSADNKQKLAEAEEAILFLKYPELAGTEVVFLDEYDTAASEALYTNDYQYTGCRDIGNWYVVNGMLREYDTNVVNMPTSFSCGYMLLERDFAVRSVSLDVQIIEDKAWAGFRFSDRNKQFYEFRITDKSHRIVLNKEGYGNLKTVYASQDADPVEFKAGEWYNVRVIFDESGLIKCYVDDRLWIEVQDVPTVQGGDVLTHGTVSISTAENWCNFDNLEVRGVELAYTPETTVQTNPNLLATEWSDDFEDEADGKDPSHWIEISTEDQWLVKAEGENLYYGSTDHTQDNSQTWLHVFETDVDYAAKLRVTAKGDYPVVALVARLNADTSYIRAGYDFTVQKWFIATRYGLDFEEVITYASEKDTAVDFSNWVDVRVKVEGTAIELYCGETKVLTADAGRKVSPGRVGVYTEQCNVDIDDVDLQLLSGQGRVNDGVMEQYTAQAGATSGRLFQVLELEGGKLLLSEDSTQYTSTDGGKTWTRDTTYNKAGYPGGSTVVLHDGSILNIKSQKTVNRSDDGGKTWAKVGELDWGTATSYSQPAEHLSEVQLEDGTWRIFFTAGNKTPGLTDGIVARTSISEVFYSDDKGVTWTKSKNSPMDTTNLDHFSETHIIKILEDVVDGSGKTIPAGTLIHYTTYNSSNSMRYSLSYDGGVTWKGDYEMPDIPCGWNSFTIEEDLYNPGTYYMATFFNVPNAIAYGFPRTRVVLLKSTDGYNWEFMADVDRWGDVSFTDGGYLMQGVNMYLCVAKDYVFVSFSRSDGYSSSGSHNLQVGRLYRFEKDKLEAYEQWPQEYIIPDKTIISIETDPEVTKYLVGEELSTEGTITVYYYDGTTETIPMSEAFVAEPDMSTVGEKSVTVDYKRFRDVFTINVVAGDAPTVSGVENGKTYCGDTEVTVSDADGDMVSVTLNGTAVTLADGKFTVSAAEGEQTIVATDKAGNVTTIKITVNAGHTGGTATCKDQAVCTACGQPYGDKLTTHTGGTATCKDKAVCTVCGEAYGELAAHTGGTATCKDKAKCSVCGEAYGELNADNHAGEAKWTKTADKHSKAYECCGKVVVAEEAHELVDGKCECGYEAPASGGDNAGSGDNTQTGDKSALVLFGGLLALSALAAGVLLVPDIRKKLLGK